MGYMLQGGQAVTVVDVYLHTGTCRGCPSLGPIGPVSPLPVTSPFGTYGPYFPDGSHSLKKKSSYLKPIPWYQAKDQINASGISGCYWGRIGLQGSVVGKVVGLSVGVI